MTNGGLMKSTSLVALAATSGLLLSMGSALAADLGGNCCADLEERVAELEATTVKKGNRKVSLTISGQVNRASMYYNDGGRSNLYWGIDNTNSSSRFNLGGSAKISSEYSAGYSLTVDVANGARSFTVNNKGTAALGGEDANNNGDHGLRLRDATWWLQSERLGRVTVGRLTGSGPVSTIDLGGVSVVAGAGPALIGGGLSLRNSATGLLSPPITWRRIMTLAPVWPAGRRSPAW